MTSDNEPLLFYPCYMRFPSYQKILINHIIALDKGIRTYKTSKNHSSINKSTETKIAIIRPLLILTHRNPLSLLSTVGKPLSYFVCLHLCIPWIPSSTPCRKTRQAEQGGISAPGLYSPEDSCPSCRQDQGPTTLADRSVGCCPSAPPTPGPLLSGR